MKIAYVAGRYRAKTPDGIFNNIMAAKEVAKELWKMGYSVICPHLNTAFFDGVVLDEQFLKADLEIVNRCDLIVVVDNWKDSEGAKVEVALAIDKNIPVYKFNKDNKLTTI